MSFEHKMTRLIAAIFLTAVFALPAGAGRAQNSGAQPSPGNFDLFGEIDRFIKESATRLDHNVKDAQKHVDTFNRDADHAAKETANAARDAAEAMVNLPNSRVITGHENCPLAANGAPNCVAGANALCKSKGFRTGKSLDMTTAQECPMPVLLGRREAQPGECRNVTFVTRAVCQ